MNNFEHEERQSYFISHFFTVSLLLSIFCLVISLLILNRGFSVFEESKNLTSLTVLIVGYFALYGLLSRPGLPKLEHRNIVVFSYIFIIGFFVYFVGDNYKKVKDVIVAGPFNPNCLYDSTRFEGVYTKLENCLASSTSGLGQFEGQDSAALRKINERMLFLIDSLLKSDIDSECYLLYKEKMDSAIAYSGIKAEIIESLHKRKILVDEFNSFKSFYGDDRIDDFMRARGIDDSALIVFTDEDSINYELRNFLHVICLPESSRRPIARISNIVYESGKIKAIFCNK